MVSLPFPIQFNPAGTWDILPPQCVPPSNDGVAGTWVHTKRDSYGCNTIQEFRESVYSHPILRSLITTLAQGQATPFQPFHQLDSSQKFFPPKRQRSLQGQWARRP